MLVSARLNLVHNFGIARQQLAVGSSAGVSPFGVNALLSGGTAGVRTRVDPAIHEAHSQVDPIAQFEHWVGLSLQTTRLLPGEVLFWTSLLEWAISETLRMVGPCIGTSPLSDV